VLPPSTALVQEGSYWPFARLPPRIDAIGQGPATVFAGVPGGGCTHWNCGIDFSLVEGCAVSAGGDEPCVFGRFFWQTVFGNDDPLAGQVVQLHRGVHGHLRRGESSLGGVSLSWPAATNGVNEVTLRSGHEAYLIALANALVDAHF